MATNITALSKVGIPAANAAADKAGPSPQKRGDARIGWPARRNAILAAIGELSDSQKARLATLSVEEKHLYMADVLVKADTCLGIQSAKEQVEAMKAFGADKAGREFGDAEHKVPSWPTVAWLDRQLKGEPEPAPKTTAKKSASKAGAKKTTMKKGGSSKTTAKKATKKPTKAETMKAGPPKRRGPARRTSDS